MAISINVNNYNSYKNSLSGSTTSSLSSLQSVSSDPLSVTQGDSTSTSASQDVVEISDEARAMATKYSSETSDTSATTAASNENTLSASNTDSQINANQSKASQSASMDSGVSNSTISFSTSVSSSSTSSTTKTYNLSIYSDYQLEQMLSENSITQAQYNMEIGKRKNTAENSAASSA